MRHCASVNLQPQLHDSAFIRRSATDFCAALSVSALGAQAATPPQPSQDINRYVLFAYDEMILKGMKTSGGDGRPTSSVVREIAQ